MATILRPLSYKYQWLYNTISGLASLSVGGEKCLRQLPLNNLSIDRTAKVLDLCCGAGAVTQILVQFSEDVTGLDISPIALARAAKKAPQAKYVEAIAQSIPFPDNYFNLVHTSAALHEMNSEDLVTILKEVHRVLQPGGIFTLVDFHQPTNILFWPLVAIFLWLFETETAWQLLHTDLNKLLQSLGFKLIQQSFYAGGSLQLIQVKKI
jgi:demethylmenaquinone methyltransferase/2-methoxy-6-polyprenyl-1,4-benzoquinol methylase